jgi:uncharacterized membrane protein
VTWSDISQSLVDILILVANGFLAVLYWLAGHWAVVLVWPIAIAIVMLLDGEVSRRAGHRPRRRGRGKVQRESPTAYANTLGLAMLWSVVAVVAPAPIPYIGLAMWVGLLATPMAIAMERDQILTRLRWMLTIYTAAAGGFLLLMRAQLSPQALAAWSRSLGQPGAGEALQTAVYSSITPYAAGALWVIGPLMYFGYIAQRFAVHSKTKVSPWATVEDRIQDVRGRGER